MLISPGLHIFKTYPAIFSIGCPQQTSSPPPTFVTVTSLPHTLHLYCSPTFWTPIVTSCSEIFSFKINYKILDFIVSNVKIKYVHTKGGISL